MRNLVTSSRLNLVAGRVHLVPGWVNLVTGRVAPTSSRINETKNNRKLTASSLNPPRRPRPLRPPRRKQKRPTRRHGSPLKKSSSSTRNFWNGEIADCFLSKCPGDVPVIRSTQRLLFLQR